MKTALKLITLSFVLLGPRPLFGAQDQTPPKPEQAPPKPEQTPPTTEQAAPKTDQAPTTNPTTTTEQSPAKPEQAPSKLFAADRLEQLAAPIALYPDPLVAQVLMASTYPLEIVEAARWVEANPALKGDALQEALKQNEWDPSVKALCGFPTVLKQMNDNIAWTRDLGDAFLAQKTELMDTIQSMRRKALEAGTLKTNEQQTVAQDNGAIVVQPANPDVIYVPTYSPAVVYGPGWYYPSWYYPGWYYPWPWAFVSFGIGFFWGCGCWGSCNWHNHCCNINCHQFNNFNTHTAGHTAPANFPNSAGNTATWQHDPAHRAGVNYRSTQVAHQFGAAPGSTRVTSAHAAGTQGASTGTRGSPAGPGARAASGAALASNHASTSSGPSAGRSGANSVGQHSGAGPGSGRLANGSARGLGYSAAPRTAGTFGASSYRGNVTTYRTNPYPSRGTSLHGGGMSSYRSPSTGRSFAGWGGASRGSAGSFGGGWHGGGSFGGGMGHSGASFGGHGFGGGGFHGGGGHR